LAPAENLQSIKILPVDAIRRRRRSAPDTHMAVTSRNVVGAEDRVGWTSRDIPRPARNTANIQAGLWPVDPRGLYIQRRPARLAVGPEF